MAEYKKFQELALYQAIEDLTLWLVPHIGKWPKSRKGLWPPPPRWIVYAVGSLTWRTQTHFDYDFPCGAKRALSWRDTSMLIVYRTNEGFTGRVISLERRQSALEFEAWRATAQPTPEMAAIEVDEKLMRGEALADLATNTAAYLVVDGALTLDGEPVELGYEPSATGATERMRADPNMVALFDMDEAALRMWMATQTQADINVLVWQALRELARAAKVAVR